MSTTTIESILLYFKEEHNIFLSKMPRKKIIYDGKSKNSKSIVVVMPASKIYARGNGWVDFTKIQIDVFKQYKISIVIFRLLDGTNYFIDMNALFPLLTKENMMVNKREGEHWKMDIWKNKIVLRGGGKTLHVVPNEKEWISKLL